MPLTPFHWSVLIFGLIFSSIFYIPALAISSVIMDIEPFYYMFIAPSVDGNIHGFFHTYIGATGIGLVVAFIIIKIRKSLDKIMELLKLGQSKIPEKEVYYSSLLAAYSHIFLDSFMHSDLKPFWPVTDYNPFLDLIGADTLYLITVFSLLLVILLYISCLVKK